MTTTFSGKQHDLFSYSGALLVAVAVALFRLDGDADGMMVFGLGQVGLLLWCGHFLRRILECLFVHRYAGRRVPVGDALGEYAYYFGFGAWNAWAFGAEGGAALGAVGVAGVALFVFGEVGNVWAHLKLRGLRRPGTSERGIPTGGLFELVSCANYSYEILSWLGFAVVMRNLPSAVFVGAIVPILASWAKKRHARYHELFDGREGRPRYPTHRRALVPWVFLSM